MRWRSRTRRSVKRWPRRPDLSAAALLPPAGEGGAERRMRVRAKRVLQRSRNARSKARFAALALPHPPFGHLLPRSEEHTSELQSLMRISYAVFCLKKKNQAIKTQRQS